MRILFYSIIAFTLLTNFMVMPTKPHTYTMLCLGDSYTIGEAVDAKEQFPSQLRELLKKQHYTFAAPEIIATTGWTTDELASAITDAMLDRHFDFVTLLIGVNNQYRGRNVEEYKKEFAELLQTAITFANGKKSHVVVVSIPDWGVTPFAAKDARGKVQIGKEIDAYNEAAEKHCESQHIQFIDITPHSRKAEQDESLLTTDGLHPSGKMYAFWASKIAAYFETVLAQ
jgi:lysophospholipase L1-like esterase